MSLIPIYGLAGVGAFLKASGKTFIFSGMYGGDDSDDSSPGQSSIPSSSIPIPSDYGQNYSESTIAAPIPGYTATQYWYGRVNYWNTSKSILNEEISLMKSVGLKGYIIEMVAGGGRRMRQSPSSSEYKAFISTANTYYKHLHTLCKANGIWLFAALVNDNALSRKHGNVPINPIHYYDNVGKDMLNIVLDDGPDNVIIQPISELAPRDISNHPGLAWQINTVSILRSAGFLTCNNDGYGRPSGYYGGCNYRAWHPNSISSSLPGNSSTTFIVSDTGKIISELNGGANADKINANCSPSRIRQWRGKCAGYAVCGYYDYKRRSFNPTAIRAMAGQ